MSKKTKKILTSVCISVVLFFYFWGLSYYGNQFRANHPKKIISKKTDTTLVDGWKFHLDDNLQWTSPDFSDSLWATISTDSLPDSYKGEVAWFRLHLQADCSFLNKPIALSISHFGASEIYLDGFQIASFGKVAKEKKKEENIDPQNLPVNIHLQGNVPHLVAIRYSNLHYADYKKNEGWQSVVPRGFNVRLTDNTSWLDEIFSLRENLVLLFSLGAFLLTLSFIHFLLFLFYRQAKGDLYFSLFAFCYAMLFFSASINNISTSPSIQMLTDKVMALFLNPLLFLTLLLFVYRIYENKFPKRGWVAVGVGALSVLTVFADMSRIYFISLMWFIIFTVITILFGMYKAIREKRPGIKILAVGIGIFALFIFIILSVYFYYQQISFSGEGLWGTVVVVAMFCALMSVPISTSIYLAYDFSHTNRSLQKKLIEVEDLSEKSIAQEKEKQEILSKQKENLEIQVIERTKEVVQQKKVIEEKNKDITDSINYAKRIQDAILPSEEQIKKMLSESFVLFKPKDIVSGDFYFFSEVKAHPQPLPLGGEIGKEGKSKVLPNGEDLGGAKVVVAAVDCTGHGVPGAMMSMVGHNHLKRIVSEQGITDTSKILDELHKQVLLSLNRDISKRDSKDGMDVSIISIDKQKRKVQFSGAVRPLYYFVNENFFEVKGERYSIAGVKEIGSPPYASTTIAVTQPTSFYLFSDGFADQFGGKDGKKLMSKNFRELITSIQNKSMSEQKIFLDNFIEEWKSGREQMDDVMVIGIKLP